MHGSYHEIVHWLAILAGQTLGGDTPSWMHPLLHMTLFWGPALLLTVLTFVAVRVLWRRFARRISKDRTVQRTDNVPGFQSTVLKYIYQNSKRDQFALAALGLSAMPILYLSLELPKIIINDAIGSENFPVQIFEKSLNQEEFLFAASGLFLFTIFVHGSLKYLINVYKGRVGERLLRRTRLYIYRLWMRGAGSNTRTEVVPIIVQEAEPIGGFTSEAFSLPVFQGGTFVTIVTFMFVQDPILGLAALGLLPIQIAIIPRLQQMINELARQRMMEIRKLSGSLGVQSSSVKVGRSEIREVGARLRRVEEIRQRIQRTKFLMKALNNFLTALTPFFFYSIGGYLVINGSLTLGALVAVLAAYKDFSSPLKELFRFYQSYEDVRIRYREMVRYLASSTEDHSEAGVLKAKRKVGFSVPHRLATEQSAAG